MEGEAVFKICSDIGFQAFNTYKWSQIQKYVVFSFNHTKELSCQRTQYPLASAVIPSRVQDLSLFLMSTPERCEVLFRVLHRC